MKLGFKIPKNALKAGAKKLTEGYGENIELEPGKYTGAVVDGRGVKSANGDQIVFDVKMGGDDLDASQQGGNVALWFSLEENRIIFLLKFLVMLGFEIDDDMDQSVIEEAIEEIKAQRPVIRLTAKQNGEHLNINADRLMDDLSYDDLFPDGDEEEEEEGEEEEEEVDDPHGLYSMTRAKLKSFIIKEKLTVKVRTSMSEEDIATAIYIAINEEPPF